MASGGGSASVAGVVAQCSIVSLASQTLYLNVQRLGKGSVWVQGLALETTV